MTLFVGKRRGTLPVLQAASLPFCQNDRLPVSVHLTQVSENALTCFHFATYDSVSCNGMLFAFILPHGRLLPDRHNFFLSLIECGQFCEPWIPGMSQPWYSNDFGGCQDLVGNVTEEKPWLNY
jgi:hypothetical protein